MPSTTPGAEPRRDARDSGSARSHSTNLETSSSDRPQTVTYMEPQTVPNYIYTLRARDGRYVCRISRAQRTHIRP